MKTVKVEASFVKITGDVVEVLVNDHVVVTTEHREIKPSLLIETLFNELTQIAENLIGNTKDWELRMFYEGRCWYLSPSDIEGEIFSLGYYDIKNLMLWSELLK